MFVTTYLYVLTNLIEIGNYVEYNLKGYLVFLKCRVGKSIAHKRENVLYFCVKKGSSEHK